MVSHFYSIKMMFLLQTAAQVSFKCLTTMIFMDSKERFIPFNVLTRETTIFIRMQQKCVNHQTGKSHISFSLC